MDYIVWYGVGLFLLAMILRIAVTNRDSGTLERIAERLGFTEIKANSLPQQRVRGKCDGNVVVLEVKSLRFSTAYFTSFILEFRSPYWIVMTLQQKELSVQSENSDFAKAIMNNSDFHSLLLQNLLTPNDELRILRDKIIFSAKMESHAFDSKSFPETIAIFRNQWKLLLGAKAIIQDLKAN